MKKYLALVVTVILLSVMLFGCESETGPVVTDTTQTETQTEAVTETTTEDPLTLNPSLMGIATKYGELLYPKRWNDMLRTNVVEKDGISTVEMFATVGEHEEIHLYDILFDGEDGVCIGAVTIDGVKIYVNLLSYDVDFDETWTEEEELTVLAMKEDINYLIDTLNELG
ncbi:MAG: hypothetical protein IJB86_04135 [Clostridia bacterium]|nr:hypothetical protein [Clostridia bacterium]